MFLVHRSANLILNLFALMVDANVPDIALEPDKTVKKVKYYIPNHLCVWVSLEWSELTILHEC